MSSVLVSHELPIPAVKPVAETYGFAFLKTGYDYILPSFSVALKENGVHTVHTAPLRLRPEAIDYIYRDSTKEHFYHDMKSHLARHAMLAMVLEGDGTEDTPPQDVLNSLKRGTNGYPNLRQRYQRPEDIVDDEDFEVWCRGEHERQDELTVTLTQRNVFHAADDQGEAIETLAAIYESSPEFYAHNETTDPRKLGRLIEYLDTLG